MNRPSVDIVIVNWNAGEHLRSCLASIADASQESFSVGKVTVVDNASHDGSTIGLEDISIPLDVITNRGNAGFAAACNQGANGSTSDYLLFLNPDARLFRETLGDAISFMQSDEASRVGICGVQLVDRFGAPTVSCSRFPTMRVVLGKMTGLDRILPRVFPSHHLMPADMPNRGVVEQVIGAFYLVCRDLYSTLGGFDPRYFLYFEEVDFALRASRLGARTYFLKDVIAYHEGNVSSDQVPASRLFYSLSSRQVFASRHWPAWQASLLPVLTFSVELFARVALSAARRDRDEFVATLRGYSRFLIHLLGGGSSRQAGKEPGAA